MKKFLMEIVGEENVLDAPALLREYAEDFTEIEASSPDLVVFVETAEQVCRIVAEANARQIPLTPRAYGTNVGGLTIPSRGGIVLDMSRMNGLEIDADNMVAIAEPGVTQRQIKQRLIDENVPLTLGYSLAPPDTSIFANALLGGLTNRSLKYGDQSDWIAGLEVVLNDGTLAKTGAWAQRDTPPFGLVPFPDLSGLFVAWQGTTGLAVKMAFQLWPAHPLNKRLFVLTYGPRSTYKAMMCLCRAEICDDIGGLSWPAGKMMMGVKHPHPVPDPGEPTFFLYVDLTAEIEEEMAVKEKILRKILGELAEKGERYEAPLDVNQLVKVNPAMGKFAEFPTELDFLTKHGGGGLSWIGTYGPVPRFIEAAEACSAVMIERGFPPMIVSRPMRGGHFGVLRFITIFDKQKPDEVEKVKAVNLELLGMLADRGFVMYKTPAWAWKVLAPRLDPGMLALMKRVKRLMDPNGIFNPGKLED